MDIVDYTGFWSCTSGPAGPIPPSIVAGGFQPDWNAWYAELRRRRQAWDRFIEQDDEEVLRHTT